MQRRMIVFFLTASAVVNCWAGEWDIKPSQIYGVWVRETASSSLEDDNWEAKSLILNSNGIFEFIYEKILEKGNLVRGKFELIKVDEQFYLLMRDKINESGALAPITLENGFLVLDEKRYRRGSTILDDKQYRRGPNSMRNFGPTLHWM